MINRFSYNALTGALFAAILAGCSAGSQFAPPAGSAGSMAAEASRGGIVSPAWVDWTGIAYNSATGTWQYYYINIWNQWKWIPAMKTKSGGGSTVGGSLANLAEVDVATTQGVIDIYSGKKIVNTLQGLSGVASAVETDSRGNTFAAANVSSGSVVEEYAAGSDEPTATYADENLQSVTGLGIDKANNVYVEGQSQDGSIEVDEMVGSGSFESLAKPGALGATAGGLAVQSSGKTTYVWIDDLGDGSDPANITRYEFAGESLVKQDSFEYSGIDRGIAVDPTGKNTSDVYAMNNVPTGSQYSVSGIEYEYPSGKIVAQSTANTASQESVGIWRK
jgi:hypothetical protein